MTYGDCGSPWMDNKETVMQCFCDSVISDKKLRVKRYDIDMDTDTIPRSASHNYIRYRQLQYRDNSLRIAAPKHEQKPSKGPCSMQDETQAPDGNRTSGAQRSDLAAALCGRRLALAPRDVSRQIFSVRPDSQRNYKVATVMLAEQAQQQPLNMVSPA